MLGSAVFRTGVAPGGALAGPWVRNPLWTAARAVPSLDLRFADNKSLVDATTGQNLVTFTRASSGTYVDSQGVIRTATTNEARFDHNPTTGESLGLLVEEQRTNLITSSEDIAGYFTEQNSTPTSNATTAPDGTTTADLIVSNSTLATHTSFNTSLTFAASTTYSYSIFVKPSGYTWLQLLFTSGFNNLTAWVNFNLTGAGSFGFTGGGELSKKIEAYPNGWYRCTITATSGSSLFGGGPAYLILDSDRNARDANYAGNNTSGAYLWGAQLEAGSFPTSYIPTTTAAATRSADVASITGTNFSSWYRQDEGTVFAETQLPAGTAVNTSSRSIIDATDGSTNNRVSLRAIASGATADQLTVRSGAATVAQFGSTGTTVSSLARKIAAVYRLDDYASWATGAVTAATDTSGALPVGVNQITVGSAVGGNEFMSGTIRRLTYWPARLANSILQQITQ